MNDKIVRHMAWALEILSDVIPPPPTNPNEVPTGRFYRLRAFAALALRDPEVLDREIKRLESDGWEIPIPFDSLPERISKNFEPLVDDKPEAPPWLTE